MTKAVAPQGFDYSGLPEDFIVASRNRARRLNDLDIEMGRNVLDMGRVLQEQRNAFGTLTEKKQARGGDTWHAWVQQELGWKSGRRYANTLIQIFNKFDDLGTTSSLGYEHMKTLATDNTPPEVREKVITMANEGKCPTVPEVRQMKKAALGETVAASDAKAKAQASGEPQLASDGRIYTPLTHEETHDYTSRRDRTYSVLDAINELASCQISPKEWLEQSDEHWLNDLSLSNIERAADWLTNLIIAYKQGRKIIDGK